MSVLPATSAYADPHLTLDQAKAKVADLQSQADVATERYNQARLAVQAAQVSAQRAQADVARQQDNVSREQRALASLAASEYRNGGADQIVALVTTKDPQSFIEQSTFSDQFARSRSQALLSMKTARKRLETLQQTAKAQIAAAQTLEQQAADNKAKVDSILAEQNRVVDNLTAAAKAAYLAQQAAERAAAQAQIGESYDGDAAGRARTALQAAYAQIGKPYVYGGAGPSSFDCSGLTAWAYAAAGVSLGRRAVQLRHACVVLGAAAGRPRVLRRGRIHRSRRHLRRQWQHDRCSAHRFLRGRACVVFGLRGWHPPLVAVSAAPW
jgi:hypothetical protein